MKPENEMISLPLGRVKWFMVGALFSVLVIDGGDLLGVYALDAGARITTKLLLYLCFAGIVLEVILRSRHDRRSRRGALAKRIEESAAHRKSKEDGPSTKPLHPTACGG